MKKIISLVLAFLMSLNICMIAGAESILTGAYTFIDSAYSPELDMYVVMAKDFNSGSHSTKFYTSTDGVEWTNVLSEANGRNYANVKARQNLVWWEKEQVFVAQMGSTLFISSDGKNWSKKTGNSNAVIETNGEMLITSAGKELRIYENLTDSPEVNAFTTSANYYTKTVGLTDDGNNITIFDQYTVYYIERANKEPSISYPNMEGTPIDTVKVPGVDCWITILNNAKIRVWTLPKTLASVALVLEEGSTNTEKITGVGASDKYIVLGTETGKLLYTEAGEVGTKTVWKEVLPAKGMSESPKEQITSISAGSDGAFIAASDKGIYSLAESEGKLLLVDPTVITIEAEMPKVEIPFEGSEIVTITPKVFDYKGIEIPGGIIDFEMKNSESGISTIWDGSKLVVEVGQSANGGIKTFVATDKNGTKHEFEMTFVKETDVGLEGFTSVAMAGYGEEKVEYSYKAYVLGSDGEKMNRNASMEAIDLPEKIEFDSETGVLTILSGASAGKIKIKVTSDGIPDIFKEFEIEIKECEPTTIEFTECEDLIVIPDGKSGDYQYNVLIKDQVARPMPEEKINWSLETPFEGVSINENGVLTIEETTVKGEITIVAKSEKSDDLKISKKVTLDWSDLRCIKEDLKKINESLVTGKNLELVTEGENGTTFTWETSNKNVITSDGIITRNRQKDTSATLTVTGKKNEEKVSKNVNVTVLKEENIASIGDFEEKNTEGLNGEITTDANNGEYAFKVDKELSFDVELNNESSYVFEAYVKASGNVDLNTKIAGKIATEKSEGEFVKIIGTYDYRKQNKSFTDTVTISSASEFVIDDIKIYEITLEYEAVMEVILKAEYSRKKADIDEAKEAVEKFMDIPLKEELKERVENIKPKSSGGGGGGSSSGGGGSYSGLVTPQNTSSGTVGITGETVNNDEKVYEHLLVFKDMSKHWAKDDVEYMANLGIVSGVSETEFNPDANITRAEFAKLIVKTVGLEETPYKNIYYDVLTEDWYSGYAQAAKEAGYISGYNGLFRPKDKITREEMAKVIAAAFVGKSGKKLEQGGALYFNDIENISGWAYDYVVLATREGFINGITEEIFAPKNNATRAQAVVMLKRLYDKLNAE